MLWEELKGVENGFANSREFRGVIGMGGGSQVEDVRVISGNWTVGVHWWGVGGFGFDVEAPTCKELSVGSSN